MFNTDLEIAESPHPVVVRLTGCTHLTEFNIEVVEEQLETLKVQHKQHVILDLSDVNFLSSVALSMFLALNKRIVAKGGRLTLVNLRPDVHRVFQITRLDTILEIRCEASF